MNTLQGSLFDIASRIEVGALDDAIDRTCLSSGAWVDVRRDWIQGADLLFTRLLDAVPWRAERRQMYERTVDVPRLLAFYDEGSAYPDESLAMMRAALCEHHRAEPGSELRTAGLCLYRDGRDSVAWHGDRVGRGNYADTVVAIVSLGAARAFRLRPRGGGRSLRFTLGSGDLLVMGGSCQRTWEHSVPKTSQPSGPRISVQFRPTGVR